MWYNVTTNWDSMKGGTLDMKRKSDFRMICVILLVLLLGGCGAGEEPQNEMGYTKAVIVEDVIIEDEAVALTDAPAAVPDTLTFAMKDVQPSGVLEKKTNVAVIDYSNTKDGYVMVKYTAETVKRLKAQVQGPAVTYTYNIQPGRWEVLPLTDGNGEYKVSLFENVKDNRYAGVISNTMQVEMTDAFAPFLRPNQYVNYNASSAVVAKAAELTKDSQKPLEKVEKIYDFVIGNLTYDTEKARTVQSGYLPVLDSVLEQKKGICFDYAALMTGMLRSQGVPCKLVVGYAGSAYHAWINVWSEETGWIDAVIFFDGQSWKRMDPTFASSAGESAEIMKYIGDGSNYTAKYFY